MPNPNTPSGFVPRCMYGGQPYSGALNEYPIASGYNTSIWSGDVVKLVASGYINRAGATEQMRGIAVGFYWTDASGTPQTGRRWPAASTTRGGRDAYALVIDDPDVLFEAQFTNSVSAATNADRGAMFATDVGAGDNALGMSKAGVDYATLATTALPWRAIGPARNPETDLAGAYQRWLFVPSLHDLRVNTGI